MKHEALITGLGLVSALGQSAAETWRALLEGQFICDHARVDVRDSNQQSANRIFRLARRAAREAVEQVRWTKEILGKSTTALVVGTSKGPIETWINAPPGHMEASACVVGDSCEFGLSQLASELAADLKLGIGPRLTLSAACASGIHALIYASLLIESGAAERALVIASEASVHPLFVASFKRLGVLPPEGAGCRPFDTHRNGFLISEAGAAVCIESSGSKHNLPIARIDRYALGADATHLTGSDPNGIALTRLLQQVVGNRPVDLVHAHATGTSINDPIELRAIEHAAGHMIPAVYSHKGALGHSLGAAGLVSVVLNCLAHKTGTIPGNVQTKNPIPHQGVLIHPDPIQKPVRRSLALAAGFGGAMGAVTLAS